MTYSEEELLPLSALQHLVYCTRQCALIHIEQAWHENRFTAEGRVQHERVDRGGAEQRGDVRRTFAMPLRSLELGLSGIADVVEFHREGKVWRPFPVEHKRGRPKAHAADRVQLCAQTMCLEEMLGLRVLQGALFYGKNRRRENVDIDVALRAETSALAVALHALIRAGETPSAEYGPKCERCSLLEACRPKPLTRTAGHYLDELMKP